MTGSTEKFYLQTSSEMEFKSRQSFKLNNKMNKNESSGKKNYISQMGNS